ncbi:MAG: mannose-1-phosphate guanylyltransferase [Fimbriimonadaceae bacterium]|nr:mannose-1-phosphate guanylyltransferase [Fimbriimonadaceae bacterium]
MSDRRVVIIAGGTGQRFWPVSRPERPKQFLRLADPEKSLLQQAYERAERIAGKEHVSIQTTPGLITPTREELPELHGEQIDAEPAVRNTMGAIIWAMARIMASSGDEWRKLEIGILTADHRIAPMEMFLETVETAFQIASRDQTIVTIGIKPDRADTGYGYIETGAAIEGGFKVKRFREKPNRETAEGFINQGNFYWNSGMFFFTLDAFDRELAQAQPGMHEILHRIVQEMHSQNSGAAVAIFSELDSDPVDIALMERAKSVAVVPATFQWDDLGTWDSISRSLPRDTEGNVSIGRARFDDANECVIYNEESAVRVNLLGVDDLCVVVTGDEILVCPRDRSQDVKRLT